jgi:hypothetical protein
VLQQPEVLSEAWVENSFCVTIEKRLAVLHQKGRHIHLKSSSSTAPRLPCGCHFRASGRPLGESRPAG